MARRTLNDKPQVGTEIVWRTRFNQYFRGIIRAIEPDAYIVDQISPAGAFGIPVPKDWDITW